MPLVHLCVAIAIAGLTGQPAAKSPKAQPPAALQPGVQQPTTVVSNKLGIIIQRGTEQGIEVAEEGRGWGFRALCATHPFPRLPLTTAVGPP